MKKVAILGLHLGIGGVEQSIINQANILCENYEVELVSIYKLHSQPAFKVNSRVKIKYLTNLKPNREEFLEALHHLRLIKAFKEGLKSLKILYLKKQTIIDYIKQSDADIIISSRVEITESLSKYRAKNVIAIAEEHCFHHNNPKYIKRVKKACHNIPYLLLVSKSLANFYEKVIPGTKCVYMPNGLDYNPSKRAKLNNKNLISIGRLSQEKGYSDLIEVFKNIDEMDGNFHLDIVGDGEEYANIKAKIKEYHLEKKITLHGFQNRDYINNLLLNSSLYLMTSLEESFGTVLIEAASFGIPAIAFSSAEGAKEIIQNGHNGYAIMNRDINQMARQVVELINNPELLQKMGEEALEVAKLYSYDSNKERWLNFLKEVK